MAYGNDENATTATPNGLVNGTVVLANGQTRYFLRNDKQTNLSLLSSSNSESDGNEEMNIIFILHPSSRIESSDPFIPASVFASIMQKKVEDAATSAFDLDNTKNQVLFVYLASRDIGGGWWCWGAGDDNNLCTAPVDNTDAEFFNESLALVKNSLALPPSTRTKVFMFGYSGGARMTWRLACDPDVSNLLDGVSMSGGLLPASLQRNPEDDEGGLAESDYCHVDQLPPSVVVLHGTFDRTTAWKFANESVHWVNQTAGCQRTVSVVKDEILEEYSNCTNNDRQMKLSFYIKMGGKHTLPDTEQMERIFENWRNSTSNQLSDFPSDSPSLFPSKSASPSLTAFPSASPTLSIPSAFPTNSHSPTSTNVLQTICSNQNIIQMENFIDKFQNEEFYMVDLYKFRNQAIDENGQDKTGAQAANEYTHFLVNDFLPNTRAQLVFNLSVSQWDEIIVVKYPNASIYQEALSVKTAELEAKRAPLIAGLVENLSFATSLVKDIPTSWFEGPTRSKTETLVRGSPKAVNSYFRDSCIAESRCPENSHCILHNVPIESSFVYNKADGTFFTCHCKEGYDANGWGCVPDGDSVPSYDAELTPPLSQNPESILFHVLDFNETNDGRSLVYQFNNMTSVDKYRYGLRNLGWLEVEAMCVGEQRFDQIRFESVSSFSEYGNLFFSENWIEASTLRTEGITSQSYTSISTPILFRNLYQLFKQFTGHKSQR
mmetsp:Transcript_32992/g.49840  ORF Transcript_32992/g.49840 Transcript_32992/m.49840 type:complete len:718 (+) Transcript_32992:52-2205(+)